MSHWRHTLAACAAYEERLCAASDGDAALEEGRSCTITVERATQWRRMYVEWCMSPN